MYLSIGGICLKIKSDDLDFIKKIAQEFSAFVQAKDSSDYFLIEVIHDYTPQEIDSISVFKKKAVFKVQGDEFIGSINVEHKTAKVHLADLAGVFNCFLRVFYSVVLLENNGFLVHSVGLACQDNGYLFAGASESGKTTTAKMAKDFQVLSDELVIIRHVNGKVYLFSTPFKGEFDGPISSQCVYLQMISFLSKNIPNGFRVLSKMETFSNLLANIFFFAWDDESNQKLINQVKSVCDCIRGYRVDLFNFDLRRIINGISKNNSAEQPSSLAAG
ncbi:MAG: hypothetical protein V1747_08560 [Candidatus Omnitrophota bacterium]